MIISVLDTFANTFCLFVLHILPFICTYCFQTMIYITALCYRFLSNFLGWIFITGMPADNDLVHSGMDSDISDLYSALYFIDFLFSVLYKFPKGFHQNFSRHSIQSGVEFVYRDT